MTTWLVPPKSGKIYKNAAGKIYTGTLGVPVAFDDADAAGALADGWVYSSTGNDGPDGALQNIPARLATDASGNVTGLVGPDGDIPIARNTSVAGLKLLADPGSQSLAGDAVNGKVLNSQLPAVAPFFGVRLVFMNYDTANPMAIDGVKVAPAASSSKINGYRGEVADTSGPNNSALTWSGYVTFGGSQSVNVPVAVNGVGGQVIPGITVSDFIQVTSIPRTDYPSDPPIIRVATHLTASANASVHPSYNGGAYKNFNTLAENPGLRNGCSSATAALAALTTTGTTYDMYGGPQNPIGAIFYYSENVQEMFTFGDSLVQGTGSTGSLAGWPARVTFGSFNLAQKIVTSNFGTSGQKTVDSLAIMKNALSQRKPKYAAFKAWSPNDGDTQAVFDAAWGICLEGIDYCMNNGIIPVVLTSGPANGYTWSRINAQNARVMALSSSVVKVDAASILNDNGVLLAAYNADGTHLNNAGYAAVANLVINSIRF